MSTIIAINTQIKNTGAVKCLNHNNERRNYKERFTNYAIPFFSLMMDLFLFYSDFWSLQEYFSILNFFYRV